MIQRLKSAYIIWYGYLLTFPKAHRYSLGSKIDNLFLEILEATISASFISRGEKIPYIKLAIRKLDTLNVFLMIAWETKTLDNKKYIALSEKLLEIGRMLGGWFGQLSKQNSPNEKLGEK